MAIEMLEALRDYYLEKLSQNERSELRVIC